MRWQAIALLPLLLISPCLATPTVTSAPSAIPLADILLTGRIEQGGTALGTVPSGTQSLALDGKPVEIAPDGRFLIGFGRDAGPVATMVATLKTGKQVTKVLSVAPHHWSVEQVDTPMRPPYIPSTEYQRIRADELSKIEVARAIHPASDGWRQPFMWPVNGRVSGVFGSQRVYQGVPGSYHGGVDIARPTGTPVTAPADGVVILAAREIPFTLEGHLLMIDHGMGLSSAFLHLSRIDVKVGDHVARGQPVGAIGTSGRSTGPHLHWGMKWQDERIDPQMLVPPMTARQ